MTDMESKEWVAEMPPRFFIRSDSWVSCEYHALGADCSAAVVEEIVTRANAELAKVRAERDAARARIAELEAAQQWRPLHTTDDLQALASHVNGSLRQAMFRGVVMDIRMDGTFQIAPNAWSPLAEGTT